MGHGLSPRIPAQCPKWIKATRSGVTTRGVSRTFPSRGQGDLGEKARSKLSKGGYGQLPRRNLSEATVGSGPWHSTCGTQLAQPSWRMATQHSMRNKEEETKPKNLFLGYSSSMELVGGQQLPVRWGQVAFTSMGTTGGQLLPGKWMGSLWKLGPDPGARIPLGDHLRPRARPTHCRASAPGRSPQPPQLFSICSMSSSPSREQRLFVQAPRPCQAAAGSPFLQQSSSRLQPSDSSHDRSSWQGK